MEREGVEEVEGVVGEWSAMVSMKELSDGCEGRRREERGEMREERGEGQAALLVERASTGIILYSCDS